MSTQKTHMMSLKVVLFLALGILAISHQSLAFYSFRLKIPNGEHVPHPCKANYLWQGVGHKNNDGGGERNPFGQDFERAGKTWTKTLCKFDSDGDGMTNGQELGDPDCEWTEGSIPKIVTNISHPGICTPYGKGVCEEKDSFVDCHIESLQESCEQVKNGGLERKKLLFKKFEIPNTETNYFCQYFDLNITDRDAHIIADESLIDNREVVHHMLLYGCPDKFKGFPGDDSPSSCLMSGSERDPCTSIIALWTVGYPGSCHGGKVGYRVGANGFKRVKLEIHYNNPMKISGYTDASGIQLYLQPNKPDVQDLATMMVGQTYLEIPPGKTNVTFGSTCTSDCTMMLFSKPMYIQSAGNHMHYMGRQQKTYVKRGGKIVKMLADDSAYSYDSPVLYKFEEPFYLQPGDEIVTTCVFSSMSKKVTVFYGDGTADEMCYSFLQIYPSNALRSEYCLSYSELNTCDWIRKTPKLGCDWAKFTNFRDDEMVEHLKNLKSNCFMDGRCRPECKEYIEQSLLKDHPCLQQKMMPAILQVWKESVNGFKFLNMIQSCSNDDDDDDGDHDDDDDDDEMDHNGECDDPHCKGDSNGYGSTASLPMKPEIITLSVLLVGYIIGFSNIF